MNNMSANDMNRAIKYYQIKNFEEMIEKQNQENLKVLENINKTFNINDNDSVYKAFEKLLKTMFPDCYVIYQLRDLMLEKGIFFKLPAKDKIIETYEKSLGLVFNFDKDDELTFTVFASSGRYAEIKPIECNIDNLKESILKINDEYQTRLISSAKKFQEELNKY